MMNFRLFSFIALVFATYASAIPLPQPTQEAQMEVKTSHTDATEHRMQASLDHNRNHHLYQPNRQQDHQLRHGISLNLIERLHFSMAKEDSDRPYLLSTDKTSKDAEFATVISQMDTTNDEKKSRMVKTKGAFKKSCAYLKGCVAGKVTCFCGHSISSYHTSSSRQGPQVKLRDFCCDLVDDITDKAKNL
jgi:uncharacterized protein involved in copper resistance